LSLDDGGLAQCLLQVADDLVVALFCLLHVLALARLHCVTPLSGLFYYPQIATESLPNLSLTFTPSYVG